MIKPLHEVTKTALLHDCSLLCAWRFFILTPLSSFFNAKRLFLSVVALSPVTYLLRTDVRGVPVPECAVWKNVDGIWRH